MSISLYMLIICRDVNAYARGNTVCQISKQSKYCEVFDFNKNKYSALSMTLTPHGSTAPFCKRTFHVATMEHPILKAFSRVL